MHAAVVQDAVSPGYSVEKKSFSSLLEDMKNEGKEIYLLDKRGDDLRKTNIGKDAVFIIGDHDGIPKQELKKIKHLDVKKISVGPYMLFASQTMTILHNELDRQEV